MAAEMLENFACQAYRIEFLKDRPAVKVFDKTGALMADLSLLFSAHTLAGRDVSASQTPWTRTVEGDGVSYSAVFTSCLWAEKRVTLRCLPDRMTVSYSVTGEGTLTDVELCQGYYTGVNARWSNARFYSSFPVDSMFDSEPDGEERYAADPKERLLIDMAGVPIPGRDHWFFTPPPFCFVARKGQTCMTLGVTTAPGAHRFTELEYSGGRGQGLTLRYEGYTKVQGTYDLPELQMIFGSDEYALLGEFCKLERLPGCEVTARPAWWSGPIFCGWGAQCALCGEYGKPAPQICNQGLYERFTASLDEKGIDPGTIVIDDKWQGSYGLNDVNTERWPDMKGFIRAMHDKGRKVLLWLKAWDPEGVEAALCIRDYAGAAQAIDPTNPAYYALFAQTARTLLGPDGLDADGFKIDFTARMPTCPGCQVHEDVWGLELMKRYLAMVHDCAKAVKGDALIMCHCPHPYLADKLDMIRLNDVNTGRPVCEQMTHRARLVRAALPDRLIDTDNWPMPSKQAWLDYVRLQPELGVPSLYYLWHMDNSDEKIFDEDLDVVREAWARARAKMEEQA